MLFGAGKDLSVLEAKFQIYEDLSKEMLDKLERAVNKISESNHSVALILERHENRLDQATNNDNLLIKMIEELKIDNKELYKNVEDRLDELDNSNAEEHRRTLERVEKVEGKAEEYSRVKWMTIGIGIFSAVLATAVSTLASGWLTPGELGYKMEHRYVPAPENTRK